MTALKKPLNAQRSLCRTGVFVLAKLDVCPTEFLAPGRFTLDTAKLLRRLQRDVPSGDQFGPQQHHRFPGHLFRAIRRGGHHGWLRSSRYARTQVNMPRVPHRCCSSSRVSAPSSTQHRTREQCCRQASWAWSSRWGAPMGPSFIRLGIANPCARQSFHPSGGKWPVLPPFGGRR